MPILEIGPGRGALTEYLLGAGYRVVAIEIDQKLCDYLTDRLREYINNNSLTLIHGDFLKLDIANIAHELGINEFCVVSNIPYHITGPILERICFENTFFPRVYLTVQWEVAKRIVANPGSRDYGSLSLMLQAIYIPRIIHRIKKTSFSPMPEVDSGFISLIRRDKPLVPTHSQFDFLKWTRRVFQYRRKTMKKILKEMNCSGLTNIDSKILKLRPEKLSIKDLYSVFLQVKCTTG